MKVGRRRMSAADFIQLDLEKEKETSRNYCNENKVKNFNMKKPNKDSEPYKLKFWMCNVRGLRSKLETVSM